MQLYESHKMVNYTNDPNQDDSYQVVQRRDALVYSNMNTDVTKSLVNYFSDFIDAQNKSFQ